MSTRHRRSSAAGAVLVAALAVLTLRAGQAPARPAAIDAFREQLRAQVAADDVGSITAAVVSGDRLLWTESFGWADRDRKVAPTAATLYRIGSISKTFTAVVLGQLVDRGTIALDDPVEKYLPEVKGFANPRDGAKPITFRQLASHTAGLIREPTLQGAASGPIAEWEAKILASIPTTAFDARPGERYAYSNIGYGVLGLALSRAAKTPFMQLVEDGIFIPLGMTSSTFVVSDRVQPLLSVGYANNADRIDPRVPALEHDGRGYKVPNGGIYSNVTDLTRFVAALTGAGKMVTSDTMRKAMLTKQTPGGGGGYGLGVQITAGAPTVFGHGGAVAGYTAHISFEPESKIGVILLRNYNSGRTNLSSVSTQLVRSLVAERQK